MLNIGYDANIRSHMGRNGEIRYTSSHRFSDKIISQGGPQRDTSIGAATKAIKRVKIEQEKASRPLEKLEETFDETAAKVNAICSEIDSMRGIIALRMLQWYSALAIQCFLRCSQARRKVVIMKASRLLRFFVHFKFYFRRRQRAYKLIMEEYRKYRRRKAFITILRRHRFARKIQRWFKHCQSCYTMFAKLHFM